MLPSRIARLGLALALLPAWGCKSSCDEPMTGVAFDEPTAWGLSASEVFAPLEGTHQCTITWLGLVESGELDQAQAVSSATIEIHLDEDSAAMGDVDPGKRSCDERLTVVGTMTITSVDGMLDDSFPVELRVDPGGERPVALADLTGHEFAGALATHSAWMHGSMSLQLDFVDGSPISGVIHSLPQPGSAPGEHGFLAIVEPAD